MSVQDNNDWVRLWAGPVLLVLASVTLGGLMLGWEIIHYGNGPHELSLAPGDRVEIYAHSGPTLPVGTHCIVVDDPGRAGDEDFRAGGNHRVKVRIDDGRDGGPVVEVVRNKLRRR